MTLLKSWQLPKTFSEGERTAIVTGGTGGIGYEVALGLLRCGVEVVIASRDKGRGECAIRRIRRNLPQARVSWRRLDTSDLSCVKAFARHVSATLPRLDILVNNAGVMGIFPRAETKEGLECQFATNYLGHYALTALLLPLLHQGHTPENKARVVHVGSLAACRGEIKFHDLQSRHQYGSMKAYEQSKLANLLFALELEHYCERHGWNVSSIAAHPGWAATDIISHGFGCNDDLVSRIVRQAAPFFMALWGQSAAEGALPVLFAALDERALGGQYYGPDKGAERYGKPARACIPFAAQDRAAALKLWELSAELAGLRFPLTPDSPPPQHRQPRGP